MRPCWCVYLYCMSHIENFVANIMRDRYIGNCYSVATRATARSRTVITTWVSQFGNHKVVAKRIPQGVRNVIGRSVARKSLSGLPPCVKFANIFFRFSFYFLNLFQVFLLFQSASKSEKSLEKHVL